MQRTAAEAAINDFDNPLGFLVNRTAYVMRLRMREKLKRQGHGLTPEECAIIVRLWQQDGQSQNELANSTIRERTTTTRMIDGLVRKGLVQRKVHPKDRRKICAWLTPKGRQLRERFLPIALEMAAHATKGLSSKDIETTIRTLAQIQANLLNLPEEKKK